MKKLFVYLKDYTKECVLGPLFKMLEVFFELLVPLVVASIIDVGIADGDRAYIARRFLLLAALAFMGVACSISAQYFAARASVGFAKRVRSALFRHIQTLSHAELDKLGVPTLVSRITGDTNQVQTGLNLTLRLLLRSPVVVAGATVMAFLVDFGAGCIFLAVIFVLALVIFAIMKICVPLYRDIQARLDGVMGKVKENLSGARVIRAFAMEGQETEKFRSQTGGLLQIQQKTSHISVLLNPMTYVIVNLAVIVLIWTGALRVQAGLLTQGAVVALCNYMSQILVELIKLADLIVNIARAIACGRRIEAVFEIKPSVSSSSASENELDIEAESEILVEFEDVGLRYGGAGADAVFGVSFAARRGETIGIIGGTGSGKTSLVGLIPRFYDATGGQVRIGGVDIQKYPLSRLRDQIGFVSQQVELFKGTIRDNVRWGKWDATDGEILRALEIAQALDFVYENGGDGKAGGLDAAIEQGGKNLSGGQRQRLAIARALIKKPDILIFDDSSSALDYATDAAFRAALRRVSGQSAVFAVSQRASSIRDADRIIVLEKGAVVGNGTHQELLENCAVYREIYGTQFQKGGSQT